DQERPRGDETEHVALLGERQRPRQHLADAAGDVQVRLIIADRADRDDAPEPVVQGAGVHGLVTTAAGPGDAEPGRVHLGAGEQVVHGPAVVVDLYPEQRLPDRPEGAAVEGAVVGAAG